MEEKTIKNFINWFDSKKKIAFVIVIITGIITHITMLTSTIMSQDGLWISMEASRLGVFEKTLGRWGIEIIEAFNFYMAIPTISTMSCIVIMAILAVFLVDLFKFKSTISVVLTSLILAVTPTFTVTLLYIYTAFAYCSNFLIATLVIWFIYKFKHKKIGLVIATILFILSLSIYQSYIGVTIGLCIMLSILELLKNNVDLKEILINIGKTVAIVVIGGLIYYIITLVILHINDLALTSYKNVDTFSISNIFLNLRSTIINAYKDFGRFFIKDSIIFNTNYKRDVFYILFLLMFGIAFILNILAIRKEKKKIALSIVFLLVLPIGLNIIDILITTNNISILTAAQMILMIPFTFALLENVNKGGIIRLVSILSCFYIIVSYYIADNVSYACLKMRYNQAYSVSVRMIDRIENTDGYTRGMPICIVGIIGDNNYPPVVNLYNYTVGQAFLNPVFHGSYSGAKGTMQKFLKIYLGEEVTFCDDETYEKIVRSDELKELSDFPEKGCTAIIENTMVIKLSNYILLPDNTLLYEEY